LLFGKWNHTQGEEWHFFLFMIYYK
jgi:hypothetical protein